MADIGKIQKREITEEMRDSYLDYAMSVIVARALPDVRDGLKPVHRRILYSMHDMGLTAGTKYRKSAAITGDCLGKYHPHGDTAVYDTMVRMAQDFAMRYPLVDGQGNFGSIDGDNAAAPRYTEARMTRISAELLRDIEKNTVDFRDNYDATRKEPIVLPAAVPNLLLNGTIGIAVGMATSIPPHNLTEVIDALLHLVDNPDASIQDIMQYVQGPDFPTGGMIFDQKQIHEVYASGNGAILMRGKASIEEDKKEMVHIIITEIPYQVNKAELIKTMANLVIEKRIDGIRDIRDESDRDGMRVVIQLKMGAQPQKVLNNLYKYTDLEKNFNLNMLALVDGIQPQVLPIKNVLEEFLKHRTDVVTRRTKFDLERTKDRIHILEGLKKALDHIDKVIATIKKSKDRSEAHKNLMKGFSLSELQANAILEMRLQTLAGLERQKIEDELDEKVKLARSLEALLKDPKKLKNVIKTELGEVQEKYGDARKTVVIKTSPQKFSEEDLIPDEETMVMLTRGGYIKRIKPEQYRMQKRGGKGLIGIETKEEDIVEHLLATHTHANLLFFTNTGKVYQIRAYEILEGSRTSKGKTIYNFLPLHQDERVTSILAVTKKKTKAAEGYIVMLTRDGVIKKVAASAFENVRSSGLIAIALKKNDELGWARLTTGKNDLLLVTKEGQSIRFSEQDVRAMGRQAAGVSAIRLKETDHVVGMNAVERDAKAQKVLVISENGYGKQTLITNFKRQRRGGSGIRCASVTQKTGKIIGAEITHAEPMELVAISGKGQVIRTALETIPTLGRTTQGVRVMKMAAGDSVASITTF